MPLFIALGIFLLSFVRQSKGSQPCNLFASCAGLGFILARRLSTLPYALFLPEALFCPSSDLIRIHGCPLRGDCSQMESACFAADLGCRLIGILFGVAEGAIRWASKFL